MAAVAIPVVGHDDIARLEAKVVQSFPSLPVGDCHLAQASRQQIIGSMQSPVVARAARLAKHRGVDQPDVPDEGCRKGGRGDWGGQ
jgi:hypothetical protein